MIELGDSSEEEIQEIAAPPARRRPTTGASSSSTAPRSAHASSSSSSRQILASSSRSQGGISARNAPATGSRGREENARSTRRAELDSLDDDDDSESDREPLRSVGDLATNSLDGLDMFRSAGGQGGVGLGSGLAAGGIDRGGLPVPRREVVEEDGMDAELMLYVFPSFSPTRRRVTRDRSDVSSSAQGHAQVTRGRGEQAHRAGEEGGFDGRDG